MSKLRFKLNRKGVRELMQSDEMMAVLKEHGDATLAGLGEGYKLSDYVGKTRANVSVKAESFKARRDNAKNNTILKALK